MGHILEGFYDPNIGVIPMVVINDVITEAEKILFMDGNASRAYALHSEQLQKLSEAGLPRSGIAAAFLNYLRARVEYERPRCA